MIREREPLSPVFTPEVGDTVQVWRARNDIRPGRIIGLHTYPTAGLCCCIVSPPDMLPYWVSHKLLVEPDTAYKRLPK